MKKLNSLLLLASCATLLTAAAFAPVVHGTYAQLQPGSNKKFVFQIIPDKTYSNVVAYVNFYSADNKRVAQKAYSITDEKDKHVRKDVCTTKVFKFSFAGNVTRVKVDHVNEGETLEKEEGSNTGKKINLSISSDPLAPIEK